MVTSVSDLSREQDSPISLFDAWVSVLSDKRFSMKKEIPINEQCALYMESVLNAFHENRDKPVDAAYFFLPEDSHVLPLFESEAFKACKKYHNKTKNPQKFIYPLTIMSFDPYLPRLVKDDPIRKTTIRGETLPEHEFQHFLGLQHEVNRSGLPLDRHVVLKISFQDMQLDKEVHTLITSAGIIPRKEWQALSFLRSMFSPRYLSDNDLEFAKHTAIGAFRSENLISATQVWWNRQQQFAAKRQEQGIQKTANIISSLDMLRALYPLWKQARSEVISFPEWYTI